ncbi:MAG TPA: hypothetical protein VFQ45_20805 [Longimicrobium sp.]|nr:hypothetical protein [Longimicrobium sp.]
MSESNAGSPVHELIQQREQLTAWLARLDEVAAHAPDRVAGRVRGDYEERLRRVNQDLGEHRGEIERDLERLRGELAEAEQRRAQAADALEEVRLRHTIGELDDRAWDKARPELERDVSAADEALAHTRGETERLHALATEIAAGEQAAAPPAAEPEPEPLPEIPATPPADEVPAAVADELPPPALPDEIEAEWEPELPEMDAEELAPGPDATLEAPSPPAEPAQDVDARREAEHASADEWDPFTGVAEGTGLGDAEEDLPWLEGIGDGSTPWTPPASADEDDSGLEFLKDIDAAIQEPAAEPDAAELAPDDLAFLEELDRAIGSSPAKGGGAATPPPPPPQLSPSPPAAGADAGAGKPNRAEPLLCRECGAINEPHAWYCEICGSEL